MQFFRSLGLLCAAVMLVLSPSAVGARQRPLRPVPVKQDETPYVQIFVAEVLQHPNDFQGRRVTVTAEVVSVNARHESLDVYDQHSRAQIGVSLAELSKNQRRRLVAEPVRRVTVYGRVEMSEGRPQLRAEQVMPVEMVLAER